MDGNRKEVRRENKQVRKLKTLRKLNSKGKTDTNRYKKLKKQVYNPFIDDRKDMKKMGAAMSKIKNPIPKYDPPKPGKYGINKSVLKPTLESVIKKNPSPTTGGHSIEMTGHPGEYLMGGGAVGGFKIAKTAIGRAIQYGTKYAINSAKKSIKPSSMRSNSL
jgi:hypothetical protein